VPSLAFHAERFGYATSSFPEGTLDTLLYAETTRLALASFDLVVSNCVVEPLHRQSGRAAGVGACLQPGGAHFRRCLRPIARDPITPPATDPLLLTANASAAPH